MDSDDILKQGKRRREIDERRESNKINRIPIILRVIALIIVILSALFGIAKYCGWIPPSYKTNTQIPTTISTNTDSTTASKTESEDR